jgi:membrane AbrB-like protein
MTATAAHNLIFSSPWRLPRGFRKTGEFLLGVTIGSMFTLAVAQFLLHHMLPVFISVGGALLSGLVCGYFLLSRTDLDPVSAFYATSPGGAAEMSSLAEAQGGDVRFVATYHSIRIGLIVLVVPLTMSLLYPTAVHLPVRAPSQWDAAHLLADGLVFLIGGVGAWLAIRLRFPGGMLVGTILAIGVATVAGANLPVLPREFRYVAQLLIGAGIGCSFDRAAIRRIWALLPIQILNLALLLTMTAFWAFLLWATTPIDWLTSILSTAPASAADMTATAIALGAAAPVVAAIQTLRVIIVSLVMPYAIRHVIRRQQSLKNQPTPPAAR